MTRVRVEGIVKRFGDTPEVDVLGAQAVGMDVIWIDNGTKALPPGTPPPTHTVRSFVEVGDLL